MSAYINVASARSTKKYCSVQSTANCLFLLLKCLPCAMTSIDWPVHNVQSDEHLGKSRRFCWWNLSVCCFNPQVDLLCCSLSMFILFLASMFVGGKPYLSFCAKLAPGFHVPNVLGSDPPFQLLESRLRSRSWSICHPCHNCSMSIVPQIGGPFQFWLPNPIWSYMAEYLHRLVGWFPRCNWYLPIFHTMIYYVSPMVGFSDVSILRWLIFFLITGLAFAFLAFLLLLTARRSGCAGSTSALRGAPVQLLGTRREQKKLRRLVLPENCAAAVDGDGGGGWGMGVGGWCWGWGDGRGSGLDGNDGTCLFVDTRNFYVCDDPDEQMFQGVETTNLILKACVVTSAWLIYMFTSCS